DVAIALVDRGTAEPAGDLSVSPDGRITDLVDDVRHAPDLGIADRVPRPSRGTLDCQYTAATPRVTRTASIRGFVHNPDTPLGGSVGGLNPGTAVPFPIYGP